MTERRHYAYTWDDDGPDALGHRRFTLYWRTPAGERRVQCLHDRPEKHITNGRRRLGDAICTYRNVRDADQAWAFLARCAHLETTRIPQ